MSYTQEELDDLIACRKVIARPPRLDMRPEGRHQRNDMRVVSEDGTREFTAFIRQNIDFQENFSIGPVYLPRDDGRLILLRCNGPHGEHVNDFHNPVPHFGHHIHRASVESIESGGAPERLAELTTEYANFTGALRHFLDLANIEWSEGHFPILQRQQGRFLFDEDEDDDQ